MTRILISAAIAVLSCAYTAQADHQERSAPDYFNINSIVYAGSGCPAGTVAENISPDLQAFTLLFDSYFAEVGEGVATREKRKNCTINLSFSYPPGWQFALIEMHARGFVSLEQNVTAQQKTSFYFQGDTQTGSFEQNFSGPTDEDYIATSTIPFTNAVWSNCAANRALNVGTQVRLDNSRNRNGSGLITIDSIDGVVTHFYGLTWRRC